MPVPNPFASLTSFLSENLPKVYVDNITLDHQGGKITSEVRYVVENKLQNAAQGDVWLSTMPSSAIMKYVSLLIMSTTNKKIADEVMKTQSIAIPDKYEPTSEWQMTIVPVSEGIATKPFVDADTTSVVPLFNKKTFIHDNKDPKYLYCFIFAQLDIGPLFAQFGLGNFGKQLIKGGIADMASWKLQAGEKIIEGGKVVSASEAFTTTDGDPWYGDITYIDEKWWGTEKSSLRELIKIVVPNSKVQDFRTTETLRKFTFNNNTQESYIDALYGKFLLTNDKLEPTHAWSYFTDLHASIDMEGSRHLYWFFNMRKFLQDNSVYAGLLQGVSDAELTKYLTGSRIRNLKLWRVRRRPITALNKVGNWSEMSVPYDMEEPPELVVEAAENETKSLIPKTTSVNGNIVWEPYNVENNKNGLRMFAALDKEIAGYTTGYYAYEVEVIVEDATKKNIFNKFKNLGFVRRQAEKYLTMGEQGESGYDPLKRHLVDNYDFVTGRFTETFAKKITKELGEYFWNNMINEYLNMIQTLADISSKSPSIDEDALKAYLNNILDPSTANPDTVRVFLNLLEILQGEIESVVNTGKNSLIEEGTIYNENVDADGAAGGGTSNYMLHTNFLFPQVIDVDGAQEMSGLVYMGSKIDDEGVITEDKYKLKVAEEIQKYFKDPGKSLDMSINGASIVPGDNIDDTAFSYITPEEAMDVLKKKIPFKNLDGGIDPIPVDHKAMSGVLKQMQSKQTKKHSPAIPYAKDLKAKDKVNLHMTDILESKGITVQVFKPHVAKNLEDNSKIANVSKNHGKPSINPEVAKTNNYGKQEISEEVSKVMNSVSVQVKEHTMPGSLKSQNFSNIKDALDLSKSENLYNTLKQHVPTGGKAKATIPHNTFGGIILTEVAKNNNKLDDAQKALASLPIPWKALAIGSVEPGSVQHDWKSVPSENINKDVKYGDAFTVLVDMIMKVQILTGFKKDQEGIFGSQMKAPEWKMLEPSILKQLPAGDYLCRLDPWAAWMNKSDITIYDSYFLYRKISGNGVSIADYVAIKEKPVFNKAQINKAQNDVKNSKVQSTLKGLKTSHNYGNKFKEGTIITVKK